MQTFDDEPRYAADRFIPLERLRREVAGRASSLAGRPLCVGIDGRSASGKSTVAQALAEGRPEWAVVHTDDVAWWHSFFGWDELLIGGILAPVWCGEPVAFRPPAWEARGRDGAIEVPGGTRVLVVEGVGATRRSLAGHLDVTVWVHTPIAEVERREQARLAAGHVSEELQRDWMASELAFLAEDRPWSRAVFVVSGTAPMG